MITASLILSLSVLAPAQEQKPGAPDGVSYDRDVRPILQARCQGCHQPAKAKGGYVMTSFDRLLKGGDDEGAAVVPGNPGKSALLRLITPKDGKAEMPKGHDPLTAAQIDSIRRWITEGAKNDSPARVLKFDMKHPPVYSRAPVITSIDYSPDGKYLAVAGFHEVLLWKADGSERVARLVGLSERVQSVRFSPDSTRLAVTGGQPARMGEVQIWNVEKRKLDLSVSVTFDTVFGASWSPDGTKLAFGCTDTTLRAIDAKTGKQVLFQGAHDDWVLDTVFSNDGSKLVSVGRDRSVKLVEVATEQFIDNVTSITPGALKGGIGAVARHPKRDEIVVGGADGIPKVFVMNRRTKRVIGDNANLVREMPAMTGRVTAVAVGGDGKRIAAASSLDGRSEVAVFAYEFDTSLPGNIKKIQEKVVTQRSAEEKATLKAWHAKDVKRIALTKIDDAPIYTVAYRPDGKGIAVAGGDGMVRFLDAADGHETGRFSPAPVDPKALAKAAVFPPGGRARAKVGPPEGRVKQKVLRLETRPAEITLTSPIAYTQLVVMATLDTKDRIDVTRRVRAEVPSGVATVSPSGLVEPKKDGRGIIKLSLGGGTALVPVTVKGVDTPFEADFIRDVNPVMSRIGCNAGTCHGSKKGKNGFKLSLRGYDAILDVRSLTDDLSARRVNLASPDDSMMLTKSTGAAPHEGGGVVKRGTPEYRIIRSWIAAGARLDRSTPRIASIEIRPAKPVIQKIGGRQQVRVVAVDTAGNRRDVTREAVITSGNSEVAGINDTGILNAVRRGEAPILARYEGAYAAATLTVMGDRTGFTWTDPPAWGRVDELVAAKWKRMKIRPSELCTDAEFIRRVTLDLTGLPPTVEEIRAFLADKTETRKKRDALVDRLIGCEAFIDQWTNKWADLLQVNRKFLGPQGAAALRAWIRGEIAANTPYDEFTRKIITASGSNKENPPASYYKILRDPGAISENTTHLFLATRFNCTKCHDHPFEKWTQDQYYETAAFFARVGLKADPKGGGGKIGGTNVEKAKPLYEIVYLKDTGEIRHERTGAITPPKFPYEVKFEAPEKATPRERLAAWMTAPDNPYFARSYVNRLWGYLFGTGIIEPVDDIRAGNPATNPELLAHLTERFIAEGFDARKTLRRICTSRTYQLSCASNTWNEDDKINYSHAIPRRLPAEVLYDAIHRVTGSTPRIPGVPAGTRAAQLPDSGIDLPSGFLATFGRPARESACECERSSDVRLGAVMALVSGPTLADAIADGNNALTKLAASEKDDRKLVDEIFLRILNRPATGEEIDAALGELPQIVKDHERVVKVRDEREALLADTMKQQAKAREERIAAAEKALAAFEKENEERFAKERAAREAGIAKALAAVKEAETGLPDRLAAWEKTRKAAEWRVLDPSKLAASGGAKLKKQEDLSVRASGRAAETTYTVTVPTDLRGIQAFRIEALKDEKLRAKGPGRAKNGNFVLTEFEVAAAPKNDPEKSTKVAFTSAASSFNQDGYPASAAIDGKIDAGKGWAIMPKFGQDHWAVFTAKEPVGFEGGTILTIRLIQKFADNHQIGRFRLWVTTDAELARASEPVKLSDWHVIGPFKADSPQKAFKTAYPPEKGVDLKKKVGKLAWKRRPKFTDGKVNELKGDNSATYLYRTIESPTARKLALSLGSDDTISLWVNGKRVLNKEVYRGAAPDQEKPVIDLNPGKNEILMKIVNGSGGYGFYFKSLGSKGPVPVPPAVLAALDVAPEKRDAKQKETVLKFYATRDPEVVRLRAALAKAEQPAPVDPKRKGLRDALEAAKKPVPLDPRLVRMRKDAEMSAAQLKNARLTLAQDVAWALINSPSFLFNR